MSRTLRSLLLLVVCLGVVVGVTSVVLRTRASIQTSTQAAQTSTVAPIKRGSRNLFQQQEALRVAQRLGKRFSQSSRVVTGIVRIADSEQPVTITRSGLEDGENVKLFVAGRALTWRAEEGARAESDTLTDTDRELIERLVYDSPDHFVLAQLSGASYFTVAQNARPENALDSYGGPFWTVVRVVELQSSDAARPRSLWRLYYINAQTGLIDRIVSQSNNDTVEAQITSWTEQSGEKTPSHITWSVNGRAVMSYQVTAVSHNE